MDSRLYRDSQAVHLWLHLILKANHTDEEVNTDIGMMIVRRGQMITGRPTLVSETFIPDNKVKSLLRTFESKGMINIESKGRKFSLISIVKYDDFQSQNCPTDVQRMSNANASENAPLRDVCPTDVQRLSINNNNILNTNVFNDRPRISKSSPRKAKPEAAVSSPKGDKWGTADDLKAAQWIYGKVQIVCPTAAEPAWHNWANDIRLMRQIDGRTHEEICRLFQWANKDPFWCSNILCPAKLREKWSTLVMQSQQPGRGEQKPSGRPHLDFNNTNWADGLKI
ncbi:replication protein 15 [Morganella morganii]|uniref:replication protein 15 n=1 Tax=Morganella morganii TaxID=582 RepID=UPI0030D50035